MKLSSTPDTHPAPHARLRVPDAAPYLGVSPRSLANTNWRRKLGIPFFRIGRAVVFDRAALDEWLLRRAAPTDAESAGRHQI